MSRIASLLIAVLLLVVALPARADLSRPVYEKRLSNGLRVIVCPDPAGTDVSLVVRYDVGSGDEPTSLEGLAHLVEHIMFLGSKHAPRGRFFELLDRAGATNVNGHTHLDETVYHETLPPERLELALWLESDRMGYLLDRLDDGTFRRALAEVWNEYREKVTDFALGLMQHAEYGELFPAWHPYHHSGFGTPDALGGGIALADARAFAATWYGPANATLVIAGKVEPTLALALVEQYFEPLPARPPPARPPLRALDRTTPTWIALGADVTRAQARAAWITPSNRTRDDVALDLAAAMLTGRGAGWLNKALEEDQRLCVTVAAEQRSYTRASVFEIRTVVAEGHTPWEVLWEIRRYLARFAAGVTDAELSRAKRIWSNFHLFDLDSSLSWAARLAAEAQFGPLPARFDGGVSYHAAVRAEEVRAAVDRWLIQKPALFVWGTRYPHTPVGGVVLGRGSLPR